MSEIVKISEAVFIGLHAMIYMAINKDRIITAKDLAVIINASEGHLAKVLQDLAKSGLLESIRGPKGGFRICKENADIKLIDIYSVLEGSLSLKDCAFKVGICEDKCSLRNLMEKANKMFLDYFVGTTLADLVSTVKKV